MEDQYIYEPLKGYKLRYKDLHAQYTSEYFDELSKVANVDEVANKKLVTEIEKNNKTLDSLNKQIKRFRIFAGLGIFISVLGILAFGLTYYTGAEIMSETLIKVLRIIGIPIAILGLLLSIFMRIKRKTLQPKYDELLKVNKGKIGEAWKQLEPLHVLFRRGLNIALFEKTLPIIDLDDYYDSRRLDYMIRNFGYEPNKSENTSALYVLSGQIEGNPFFFCRDLTMKMGTKTYSNSITITWTEQITVNGKTQTVVRSQVLTASVTKPCPYYNKDTYLVYANEAAPRLSFKRYDSDAEKMSEKQIDRYVDRKVKKLKRKARKKGSTFTVMGDAEFDVLWGATDRDHEVEFRLLFTPLAKKQLLDLMKDKEIAYGDNFNFFKKKMINIVYPEHLQNLDFSGDPINYKHYSYEKTKEGFMAYNAEYFKKMYFAFAPVLSIPLYQHQQPREFIYKTEYESNLSFYEHESMVNALNDPLLNHPLSNTPNILKTKMLRKGVNEDIVQVTSSGFQTFERVEHVRKMGGDGRMHTIAVYWTEYEPVSKVCQVDLKIAEETNTGKKETAGDKLKNWILDIKSGITTENIKNRLKGFEARIKEIAEYQDN